jgi:hypothetical protein
MGLEVRAALVAAAGVGIGCNSGHSRGDLLGATAGTGSRMFISCTSGGFSGCGSGYGSGCSSTALAGTATVGAAVDAARPKP